MADAQHTPGPDDLRLAAEWLLQFDDDQDGGKDAARCVIVADWLDAQADAKQLRDTAREHHAKATGRTTSLFINILLLPAVLVARLLGQLAGWIDELKARP